MHTLLNRNNSVRSGQAFESLFDAPSSSPEAFCISNRFAPDSMPIAKARGAAQVFQRGATRLGGLTCRWICFFVGMAMLLPFGMNALDCGEIKLWTFNIRFDGGSSFCRSDCANTWYKGEVTDGRRELAQSYMQLHDPDIFGLQEVRNPLPFITLVSSQLLDVAGWFPGHDYYAVDRGDGEHCAIFYRTTRFTRLDQGTFWLSCTPDVESKHPLETGNFRITSWVKLKDEVFGTLFYVFNTHMPLNEEARKYSGALIRARIAQLAQGSPAILLGDFNCKETETPVQILQGKQSYLNTSDCGQKPPSVPQNLLNLVNSYREVHPNSFGDERTFHDFKGGSAGERIDHVFHTEGAFSPSTAVIRNESYEGDCSPAGCFPSDHYAVEFKFKTLLSEVYVDLSLPDILCEFGTVIFPFNTVPEAVDSVKSGGKLLVKAGSSKSGLTLNPKRPLIVTSVGGAVVLGK